MGARFCAGWSLNEMVLLPTVLPWLSITTKVAPVMLSTASFNRVMMIWQRIGWQVGQPLLDEDYPLLFAMPVVHHARQAR
jgi:hypothetical protein